MLFNVQPANAINQSHGSIPIENSIDELPNVNLPLHRPIDNPFNPHPQSFELESIEENKVEALERLSSRSYLDNYVYGMFNDNDHALNVPYSPESERNNIQEFISERDRNSDRLSNLSNAVSI